MSKKTVKAGFSPMKLQEVPKVEIGPSRVSVTAMLKGAVAEEFEKMRQDSGLNRSQLLVQMVYHCLGRSEELRDFYRRLAILGE